MKYSELLQKLGRHEMPVRVHMHPIDLVEVLQDKTVAEFYHDVRDYKPGQYKVGALVLVPDTDVKQGTIRLG